jgi:hypothetical protein
MNDKWNLFQKFLITQNQTLSITDFLINSAVVVVLIVLLELTYIKCARSISNRRQFAGVFLLIAFTTMLIISIVKSSLALSLGLVGALSIVRFRAAIKEPEELAYLFLSISIGLGLGANQTLITTVATGVALVLIWGRHFIGKTNNYQNIHLNFSSKSGDAGLNDVTGLVNEIFGKSTLTRYDENADVLEASYVIDTPKTGNLQLFKDKAVDKFGKDIRISFIESKTF